MTQINFERLHGYQLDPNPCKETLNRCPLPQGYIGRCRQWFYNLSIRKKQIFTLLGSQLLLLGFAGAGAYLIGQSLQNQLINQAKSELAVTQINYNIKIDQMGFGFRGQSDNAAIIAAAKAATNGEGLSEALRERLQQILQNEIQARNIEYATLVGKDLRIIANANADRQGEIFNPNSLVSKVLANPNAQPIKTTERISWEELKKESPPLPEGFADRDALIRYTVTPVRDPQTKTPISALVSGDIVNGKRQIVENTLKAFIESGGGYSAIYLRQPSGEKTESDNLDLGYSAIYLQEYAGEFGLAIALQDLGKSDYQLNVPLQDSSILAAAAKARGRLVTDRMRIGSQTYTLATKALLNYDGEPVAILVRGTSETAIAQLMQDTWTKLLIAAAIVVFLDLLLALCLGRVIVKPMKQLTENARKFSSGDRQVRALVLADDEVGQLAATFNHMADSIVTSEVEATHQRQALKTQAEQLERTLRQLQQTQAQLVQTEKMSSLGQLVAGIAHEINNPVSFISGNIVYADRYIQDLLELLHLYQQHHPHRVPEIQQHEEEIELEFLIDDLPEILKSMKVGAERIREIVLSLRNFSRLDESPVKNVDLHQGIKSTLKLLQNRLNEQSNRVQIQAIQEYGNLPPVECYPGQINQVFMNILSNAIDALEAHNAGSRGNREDKHLSAIDEPYPIPNSQSPTIRIRTEAIDPDWVAIRIADNGPGIKKEIAARIFDPFFTTKPVGKGTGLGLAISHSVVVEKHGGELLCHSAPGQGTEFIIKLPIRMMKIKGSESGCQRDEETARVHERFSEGTHNDERCELEVL